MEERMAGADLGLGRFQFDFNEKDDIIAVLKMEPFHFDYWMISLVRWEPVVDRSYPSAIRFWVRVMGVPLHFWADITFRSIGEAIGDVKVVDLDGGRFQVTVDGFKPLIFETEVEFESGEETVVTLRYERLFGFCQACFSLCHDQDMCPTKAGTRDNGDTKKDGNTGGPKEESSRLGPLSYKGAAVYGRKGGLTDNNGEFGRMEGNQNKGKGKMVEERELFRPNNYRRDHQISPSRYGRRKEEVHSSFLRSSRYVSPVGQRKKYAMEVSGLNELRNLNVGKGLSDGEKLMLQAFQGRKITSTGNVRMKEKDGEVNVGSGVQQRFANKAQKELVFTDEMNEFLVDPKEPDRVTELSVSSLMMEENMVLKEAGRDEGNDEFQNVYDLGTFMNEEQEEENETEPNPGLNRSDAEMKVKETTDLIVADLDNEEKGDEMVVAEKEDGEDGKTQGDKKQEIKKKLHNINPIIVGKI